jgi:hypothetical protein
MHDSDPKLPPPAPSASPSAPPTGPGPRPPVDSPLALRPLGREPGFSVLLEALLKRPGSLLYELKGERRGAIIARLAGLILVCAAVYGLVMGSLSGGTQLWAAPLKLSVGFFASILLCLPSLYIFLCLDGADLRPAQIVGAALGMLALIALLLIGFAPVSWIFSQSTDSVVMIGALHLLFWVIGLWFGVRIIKGLLACTDSPRSDQGHLKVWIVIFALVSLQMSAALRPLIGTADTLLPTEKKFFVQHWIDSMDR